MQNVIRLTLIQTRTMKYFILAIILLILIAGGLFLFVSRQAQQAVEPKTLISASVLQDTYGLRVNLLAVTAAGGMVDVRLKILDGAKAKLLLQDKKNFPALSVDSSRSVSILQVSEDSAAQEIKFENNSNLFLTFSNSGNAVQKGAPVTILFGNIELEPITAK
jgi:ABC-type Na+ efflux pump permease subunit